MNELIPGSSTTNFTGPVIIVLYLENMSGGLSYGYLRYVAVDIDDVDAGSDFE